MTTRGIRICGGHRQRRSTPSSIHVRLRPQCDICKCLFVPSEGYRIREYQSSAGGIRFSPVLVSGNKSSTTYETIARTAIMPDDRRLSDFVDGYHVCRKPMCPLCLEPPETAAVHWDCFRILDTYNVPRETLWTALAWRHPWRTAPNLFLRQESLPSLVYTTAEKLGIPLTRLPPELVHLIRERSPDAKFWRYCSAADLGLQLSRVGHAMVRSIPLATLPGWERGSPLTTTNHTLMSATLFSIDARGISRVERISADPASKASCQARPSDGIVYIIIKPEDVQHTTVYFQV